MSGEVAKPWALMRHHAGWADIFLVEAETADGVTGHYPDRASDERTSYTNYAVLARFATQGEARAARERGLLVNRTHETVVRLLPPLTITESEIDRAADLLDSVFAAVALEARV